MQKLKTNNLDSLNSKNQHTQAWSYNIDTNEYIKQKIRNAKKFHYLLASIGVIIFGIIIWQFFMIVSLISNILK